MDFEPCAGNGVGFFDHYYEEITMKRLAIFLDGTWNAPYTNTNVWRSKALCSPQDLNGNEQMVYYDIGVNGFVGGTFGKGLSDNIRDAYQWLVEHYELDDEIFIFGFSRGAYTARSLAGLIAKYGILEAGSPLGVGQIFERYQDDEKCTLYKLDELFSKNETDNFTPEDTWLRNFSRRAEIKMVGVWDTVGSVGIPSLSLEGIGRKSFNWMHTGLRTPIKNAYHAVAIDEYRKDFLPTLWTVKNHVEHSRTIEQVEQRWFSGSHGNVGGGYKSDALVQRPLLWILLKAQKLGLKLRRSPNILQTSGDEPLADSHKEFLMGIYSLFISRRIRDIGIGEINSKDGKYSSLFESIDWTVFSRYLHNKNYRPQSLIEWAKRKEIDLDKTAIIITENKKGILADDINTLVDDEGIEKSISSEYC